MCPSGQACSGLPGVDDDVRDGWLPSGEKRAPGFLGSVVLHAKNIPSVEVGVSDLARVEHAHRPVAPFSGSLVRVRVGKQLPDHPLGGVVEQGFQEVKQCSLRPAVALVVGGGR